MKLSILIPTLITRVSFYNDLKNSLEKQINLLNARDDVNILSCLDDRHLTIGEKRNHLLELANGEYICFVDDDDKVHEDFILEILDAIDKSAVDVITYKVLCTVSNYENPQESFCIESIYGLNLEYTKLRPWTKEFVKQNSGATLYWQGKPSHTMVWKTDIAKQVKFPHKNQGEDFDWVAVACKLAHTEYNISKILYYYNAIIGKNY